jgi:hypothetical protein
MSLAIDPAESFAAKRSRALWQVPLLNRNRQLGRLLDLVHAKAPALVYGSPGLGKTRLLLELRDRCSADGIPVVYVRFQQPLHAFLVEIARRLDLGRESASSISLRGAIWQVLESKPRVILLDDIAEPSAPFYRFFERILAAEGNTIVGASEDARTTGSLQRVFWNPQQNIALQPLNRREAEVLLESAVAAFLPGSPIFCDVMDRIVRAAHGNPGRIVDMCIRASDPTYRDGHDHIRCGALIMDSLMGSHP